MNNKQNTCVTCGDTITQRGTCPVCERYKSYQDYVQPSAELTSEESPYKSILTRHRDLLNENKELKILIMKLKNKLDKL